MPAEKACPLGGGEGCLSRPGDECIRPLPEGISLRRINAVPGGNEQVGGNGIGLLFQSGSDRSQRFTLAGLSGEQIQ